MEFEPMLGQAVELHDRDSGHKATVVVTLRYGVVAVQVYKGDDAQDEAKPPLVSVQVRVD